ncbi:hypothetical protein MCEMIHM21_00390 [Candidatus Pelagibacterales bacterium]
MDINRKLKNLIFIFPIILISLYYSIYQLEGQSAIDGGLLFSGLVQFPDNYSNVKTTFYNGWTILHQFTFILLKINLSVDLISAILIFIITTFYTLGIYFLVLGFNHSKIFALFLSLAAIISRENFGDIDYPVLYFSEHTYGAFSLASFTLITGLLSNNNYKSAGFISALLFASHTIIGTWVILLFVILYFIFSIFNKNFNNNEFKKILLGIFYMIIPLIISYIYFQINVIEKSAYDINDFDTYLEQWDHHRNISTIHFDYIIKTSILIFVLSFYFFYHNTFKSSIFYLFIILSCIGSMIIYLAVKFVPDLFPQIIIRAMPTRLFLLHSVIGYPILISIIFFFVKKINLNFFNGLIVNKKLLYLPIIFIFFLIVFINLDKISSRLFYVKSVFSNTYKLEEKLFWQKVNEIESNGYFITTFNSSSPTLRYGKKPYLLHAGYFDYIPYYPYTVTEIRLIIEEVYGISFSSPPTKHLGALIDTWYEELFKSRDYNDWINLSIKHNISGIIVPSNWNLKIKNKIVSKKFTAYLINIHE